MMKIVNKNESCQVLDERGRLVVSYPTEAEARAFMTGHSTATHDIADRVALRTAELVREISGKA